MSRRDHCSTNVLAKGEIAKIAATSNKKAAPMYRNIEPIRDPAISIGLQAN